METDPACLKIVLGNLLSNAIRYHDFSHVAPYVSVTGQVENDVLHLEVQDNGQGIDPEVQPPIFEMFLRGNPGSKGSGLGVYIVSEVLAKVSGTIKVESVPRKGTTFPGGHSAGLKTLHAAARTNSNLYSIFAVLWHSKTTIF